MSQMAYPACQIRTLPQRLRFHDKKRRDPATTLVPQPRVGTAFVPFYGAPKIVVK
jgi:hypothetical protein